MQCMMYATKSQMSSLLTSTPKHATAPMSKIYARFAPTNGFRGELWQWKNRNTQSYLFLNVFDVWGSIISLIISTGVVLGFRLRLTVFAGRPWFSRRTRRMDTYLSTESCKLPVATWFGRIGTGKLGYFWAIAHRYRKNPKDMVEKVGLVGSVGLW